jgi:AAA domain/DnaB-like helicase N terminal domain
MNQGVDPRLPHSPDAERAYLGGIILGGVGPDLDPRDFFLPRHQDLWRILQRRRQQGKPTNDVVLLAEELNPAELEGIGGIPFLAGLLDGLPKISNLGHYAEIIKTKAAVRHRMAVCSLIGEKLAAANGDAADVLREVSALSAPLREEVGQKRILGFKTGLELASLPEQNVDWIARGLVARGAITELGAKVKAGKTTLLMAMVRSVLDGEPFLDLPTKRSPVAYLTEQPFASFRQAMERAELLGRRDFFVLPFTETRGLKWPEVALAAIAQCKVVGAGLLVVDTLPQFAGLTGDKENNSGDALEAMLPLQDAAGAGIGVVLVRHERKSGGDVGDSGRGSSAFAGAVDIVLSLRKPEGNSPKNRRILQSLSRFSETPADLLIELADGQYRALGERAETALKEAKDAVFKVVPEKESEAVDLQAIVLRADLKRPTAQRATDELLREGMLNRIGKGKKGDPFRYFLPEMPFCPTSHREGQKKTNQESDLWSETESA